MLIIRGCNIRITKEGIFIPRDGIERNDLNAISATRIEVGGIDEGESFSELLGGLGIGEVDHCYIIGDVEPGEKPAGVGNRFGRGGL
jgi:hypothetical protein